MPDAAPTSLPTHQTFFHAPALDLYYRPEMAVTSDPDGNYSRSPSKPRRFVAYLDASSLGPFVTTRADFPALARDELALAHTAAYVDGFLAGRAPHSTSNDLAWTPEFGDTVRYTNGSLVAAVRGALAAPARIALSPTSGFHHARPAGGSGFCTFSGQVISAVIAWREHGARGAWIDLDAHFGNSIEDSRAAVPELAEAIPEGCNLNPAGHGAMYLADLERKLATLGARVLSGEIQYVAFAHGADSHRDDDLGGQCSTDEWLAASRLVYDAVLAWSRALGRPIPLVLALFGGYRRDAPDSVLELHVADAAIALATLAQVAIAYVPSVVPKGDV